MFRRCMLMLGFAFMAPALAQTAYTPPSIEDIWKPAEFSTPVLSRDGKWLAATVPIRGRMNLAVMELETRKTQPLTGYTNYDVQGIRWVGERLMYTLGQNNAPTGPGQFDGGGLFVINRDGTEPRRLSNTVRESRESGSTTFRSLSFYRPIPNNTDEIIASGNMTDAASEDLYRLNIRTGKYSLITQGRPSDRTYNWIMDSKLVPRVVMAGVEDKLTQIVFYRKDADSPWKELWRYDALAPGATIPLAINEKTGQLRVASNVGRDTMAIFNYDPEARTLGELLVEDPFYDMGADASGASIAGGVNVDPETNQVLSYYIEAEKPRRVWLDEKNAAMQKALDAALPNRINSFFRIPNTKQLIVTSFSDTQPRVFYLLDEEKRRMEELGSERPWLKNKLVAQRPFRFKSRDGLEFDGYYFLPHDYKPGTKLPTVVHIHGGPMARADRFGSGFGVTEGQLFASRGYAVIVPNFRVTPGMGAKRYYAGVDAYGRQMSDDHEDAVKWGIEQGFVDPENVCISGASYGGYAALQAQVRNPTMWKCSVSGLAVTDVKYFLTTGDGDASSNDLGVGWWKRMLGVTNLNDPKVREISPVFNASKIQKPVYLYAGKEDIRVPIAQIEEMARNLTNAGNAPKGFMVKPQEGHGYGKLENRVELYSEILEFLRIQFAR